MPGASSDYLLIRGARQLLTLRGPSGPRRGAALRDPGIIQDGAVLVRNGAIYCLGPSSRIENLSEARKAREIDAAGCVVMPGFVDSHTHLVCGPARLVDYDMRLSGASYEEIAAAGGGILQSMRAVRELPIRRLVLQARRAVDAFIRHGTTTLEAKSGYGLNEPSERKALRAIAALNGKPLDLVPTFLGAHAVPPEFAGKADAYIEWLCTYLMPKIRRRRMAEFADVYCERSAFSVEQARRYLAAARELGLIPKIHAEQFSRFGGTRLAVEMEAASADHCDYVEDEEIGLLARSNTIATLLPGAVFHLGLTHYPPARKLIDGGAAVALATDFNPGTSPTYSMPMVLSLACSQMRMTPAEAIAAATINGAHALRLASRVGSIEAGKQADFVIFKVPDYREIPYRFGANQVAMTIKRGVILYEQAEIQWEKD
jgi:imidazolonepropionase